MKGASKVIMGATLVMVVSLAVVLALVLVLLAELYCTLLLRRRQLRISSNATAAAAAANTVTITTSPHVNTCSQPENQSVSSPPTFYAPGVLQAPRSLFFPAISCKENKGTTETKNQDSNSASPRQIGIVNTTTSPPSTSFITSSSPHHLQACGSEHFVYISNPIYDNEASRVETPFETPDSSPSRLETGSNTDDDEDEEIGKPSSPHSVPLTPMKKLPKEACSVSLRDARSLGTSGSESVSNNGLSSSSSGSPCTSPSW